VIPGRANAIFQFHSLNLQPGLFQVKHPKLLTAGQLKLYVVSMKRNPHVERAIELCGGSQTELARRIGGKVRQGHVWKWLHMAQLPPERAVQIELAVGIPRHEIRPDIFGPKEAA
jgi:DNA-binding transcriptional regulator YdaS (Cro superfamily)